jgi:superfamily II DNA or RNA helicase
MREIKASTYKLMRQLQQAQLLYRATPARWRVTTHSADMYRWPLDVDDPQSVGTRRHVGWLRTSVPEPLVSRPTVTPAVRPGRHSIKIQAEHHLIDWWHAVASPPRRWPATLYATGMRQDCGLSCCSTARLGVDQVVPQADRYTYNRPPADLHRYDGHIEAEVRHWFPAQFQIDVTRCRFPAERDEPGHRPSQPTVVEDGRPKLPRVQSLGGPLDQETSLEERLRWILSPPVNQRVDCLSFPKQPFPFQLQGIGWLRVHKHALLADEMGLGKTMQAIIAARLLWRDKLIHNLLIVCPRSLMANWKRELTRWWPEVSPHVLEVGTARRGQLQSDSSRVIVKLVTYDALARELDWLTKNEVRHDLVVLDEAQRIKNPNAKATRAVKQLRASWRWALTGTPLENRLEDLISIFGFVHPTLLSGEYLPAYLSRVVAPFLLRRRSNDPDIDLQLPPIVDQDVEIDLSPLQRKAYELAEREGVIELNASAEPVTVHHVFALIRKLIQICNFDPLSRESAKLEMLTEDLGEMEANEKKALIFSQMTSQEFGLRGIGERLTKSGFRVGYIYGDVPPATRERVINSFSTSPSERVLLLNYQAGGVGLNLQAAQYVYLFDRWWNPAVEDQAVKRAHRIGQRERVIVRRFLTKNTIEERIAQKLNEKRRLFRQVLDSTEAEGNPHLAMGLSEQEMFSLFKGLTAKPRVSSSLAPADSKMTSQTIDALDPLGFERLVADLYRARGYAVQHVGGRGDGGIDVIAESAGGGHERLAIQCKHYTADVGPDVVRELWGSVNADQSITLGVLVCSSGFTTDARAFARGKRIELIDAASLVELLAMHGVDMLDNTSEAGRSERA